MGVGYGSTTITNISGGVVSMYGSAKYTQDQVSTMCQNGSQNWAVESVPSDLHVGDTVYIYVYLPNSNVIGCAVTGTCDVINSATSIHIVTPRFVPLLGESIASVTNYYLATSASSGVTRSTSGWTTTIQSMDATKQYLWNYEVTTGSNGSVINTTDPIIIGRFGQDGGAGKGISNITEYYLASNLSSGVTTSDSGWTTTVQTTDKSKRYLWNFEVITYTTGTPYTSDPRIIGTYGDTGDDFIWNNFVGTYAPDVSSTDKRPKIYGQDTDTATNVNNCSVATHGFRVTNTGASVLFIRFGSDSTSSGKMNGLVAGQTYTLSFDAAWKVLSSSTGKSNSTAYYMRAYLYTKASGASSYSNTYTDFATVLKANKGTDMTGRCEYTFTIPNDTVMCYLAIKCTTSTGGTTASHYASGDYIELSNLMLCDDDKAQPWSPHPTELKPQITASKSGNTTTILADGTTIATILDGTDGTDGHSPTITTTKSNGVTIISADGVEIGRVSDGTDGEDGNTPSITATKSNGVTTVKVDGVTIATINDGSSVTITSATKVGSTTTVILHDASGDKTLTIDDGQDGSNGQPGANGYVHTAWANSADGTSGFSTSDSVNKLYLGVYSDNTAADSTNPSKYNWSKIKGEQGVQGPPGNDGTTYYTWLKYADTPTSGMSDSPTGKNYIGLAYNKTSSTESSTFSDYSWSLIKGEQGVQGPPGNDGTTLYTWIKYADDASGNGISDDPTGKEYIGLAYNKTTATESTTKTDYTWSLIKGDTGIGISAIVTEYYLSTSDSSQTGGSWSTTPAAYVDGRYYWKRDKITWTEGSPTYTTAVLDNALTNANANALQAGQPNISPFYARVPYAVGDYWTGWSGTLNNPLKLTPLSDGWVHVEYDNRSGSDISRCDEQMIRSDMVKEGADYTFLIEVRNNTSTGSADFYIVQTDNCQFWGSGIKKNLEGNNSTSTSINFSAENVARDGSIYYKRFVKTSEATGSEHWSGAVNRLCSLTFRAGAGVLAEYDIRVSLYEGEYWGPYKPYVDYGLREEFENLEVGGRNLLLGTGEPVEKTIALNASNYMTIDAYKTIEPVPDLFNEGDYLTISFDWETTATDGYFRVECGTVTPYVWGQVVKATGGRSPNTQYIDFASDNTSGHFEIVYKVTSAVTAASTSLQWLRIRIDGAATSGKTFKISNAKCERGKNASDWTPAPEDMYLAIQTSADGKNKNVYAPAPFEDPADWPTAGFIAGDVWWDPTDGYKMYEFDGYEWKAAELDTPAFKAGSIKAGVIDAGAITADKIAARAVTANKISIGDFTNLATVNENYSDTMNNMSGYATDIETIGGAPYIKKASGTQSYIMFNTDKSPCVYRTDDEFYYEFIAHADTALSAKFIVWGYGVNGIISEETSAFNIGTTDSKIIGTIKLTRSEWSNVNSIIFGLSNISSSQVYVKNIIIRKKGGGELIVDGSITADKIAAGTITGDKLNISDVISVGSFATQEDVNSIQVGGRNLIVNTFIPVASPNYSRPHLLESTIGASGRGVCTVAKHGLRFTIDNSNVGNWQYFRFGSSDASSVNSNLMGLEPGETYTYSFDVEYKLLSGRSETSTDLRLEAQLWATLGTSTSFGRRVYQTIHEYKASDLTDRGVVLTDRVEFTFTVPETATRLYIDVKMANTDIKADYLEGDYIELQNLKLEKGSRATDYTPATEDLETSMSNGRNIIKNTLNPVASPADQRPRLIGQIANTSGRNTCTVTEHGLRFTLTSANWQYIFFGSSSNSAAPDMLGLEPGETYTFSCDASWKLFSSTTGKADATTYYFGAMLWYSTTEGTGSFTSIGDIDAYPITQADKGTNMSGRIEFTFTVPLTAKRLYFGIKANNNTGSYYASGDYIEARNIKMEKGTRATAYTPAPEDMIAEEQIIYCQAASNTSPTSPGSTWITSTSESVVSDEAGQSPTWTTKRPTYRRYYPFLFTAKQSRTSGETVITGTITRDDTTTIIDGGHIITGSIDADKIQADAINGKTIKLGGTSSGVGGNGSITMYDSNDQSIGVWDKTGFNISQGNITGGTLRTTAGDQRTITQNASTGAMSATTVQNPEQGYVKIMNQGVQIINPNTSAYVAQILQANFSNVGGNNFYGWYIIPSIYTHSLYIDSGIVLSDREVGALIVNAKNALWPDMIEKTTFDSGEIKPTGESMPNGIQGYVKKGLGIVTIKFDNFSFAAGTTDSSTSYRLPSSLWPVIELDLESTINQVRFRITTNGYIRPFTTVSSVTTIRGTFTYQKDGVPGTYFN